MKVEKKALFSVRRYLLFIFFAFPISLFFSSSLPLSLSRSFVARDMQFLADGYVYLNINNHNYYESNKEN